MQLTRRFLKTTGSSVFPVLSGLIAYPVQQSDQTANPPVPGPTGSTGRFGLVFKTLSKLIKSLNFHPLSFSNFCLATN
jgi:hypothetical protein